MTTSGSDDGLEGANLRGQLTEDTKRRVVLAAVFSSGAMVAGTAPPSVKPEFFVLVAAGWFGIIESLDRSFSTESER